MHKIYSDRLKKSLIIMRHGKAHYTPYEDAGLVPVNGSIEANSLEAIQTSITDLIGYCRVNSLTKLAIVTSPKLRCLQTTEVVENMLKQSQINTYVIVENNIRDVDVVQGSYARWEKNLKEGENWMDVWLKLGEEDFLSGEENVEKIYKRTEKVINQYLDPNSIALFVCHEEIFYSIAKIFHLNWQKPNYGEVWIIQPK